MDKESFEFHDFKSLYKLSKSISEEKKEPIFNYKEFEVYFSLICSVILTIVIVFFVITNLENNMSFIVSTTQNMLLYTIAGLIAMLGFIVGGLAIISGTMSSKVIQVIIDEKKYEYLLTVLFSFFYIGFIIGILIVLSIILYFVIAINIKFYFFIYILITLLMSYGVFFTLFYTVSLLGTCINIFIINYIYSQEEIKKKD
ncbi:hypothetical protein COI41_15555 [Bacillus toyonensis]|uniref:hypothetical protein n=1 Tax=Bacillus cereus group TaxID=86661 RepID=UPI000BFE1CBC|nr:hypothetical protein [Bacillus toyonensis]PHF53906.1 hypothetical protein COI41_15555 [Bacillus toyonensis]